MGSRGGIVSANQSGSFADCFSRRRCTDEGDGNGPVAAKADGRCTSIDDPPSRFFDAREGVDDAPGRHCNVTAIDEADGLANVEVGHLTLEGTHQPRS